MEVVHSWDRLIRRWSRNVNSTAMPGLQQLLTLIASFYSWHQELVGGIFDAQRRHAIMRAVANPPNGCIGSEYD